MGLISPKINQDNENVLRTHTSEIHRYERLKFNVLTYRLMVLNKVCNNMMQPPPYDATCFLTFQTPSVVQGIVLFLCIVVLLCSQLYHKYLYTIYLRTNGPSSIEFMNTLQDHSVQCIVCLVLLVYLCTNTGLFGIAIKGWNIYIWFVVSFFVCVITVYGIEKVKGMSIFVHFFPIFSIRNLTFDTCSTCSFSYLFIVFCFFEYRFFFIESSTNSGMAWMDANQFLDLSLLRCWTSTVTAVHLDPDDGCKFYVYDWLWTYYLLFN